MARKSRLYVHRPEADDYKCVSTFLVPDPLNQRLRWITSEADPLSRQSTKIHTRGNRDLFYLSLSFFMLLHFPTNFEEREEMLVSLKRLLRCRASLEGKSDEPLCKLLSSTFSKLWRLSMAEDREDGVNAILYINPFHAWSHWKNST